MSGSQEDIPPPPPPSQTPTQQTPYTVSTIKLPILKKREYDIWAMKMAHYLCPYRPIHMGNYIQNGNGPVSISTDTQGQIKVLPLRTTEEILARERERKARTTLLMALQEDHLAKFHKMTNAKEMWEAITSRFGGNDESKKMQKSGKLRKKKKSMLDGIIQLKQFQEQLGDASIEIQAYTQALKKVEAQLVAHQQSQLCQMSVRDKAELGYGNQMNKGVLSYENEVFQNVFVSKTSKTENSPVNDRYAEGMHVVPPPMTGIYIPSGPDKEIDHSQFTYGPNEETHESMLVPVDNEPTVVSQPKVWNDAPIIEEYESDSEDEHVSLPSKEQETPTSLNGDEKVLNSPCFMVKSWLVQDQTVLGKDHSNLLIADSLLKTIWFINAPCYGNEALASPKANGCKDLFSLGLTVGNDFDFKLMFTSLSTSDDVISEDLFATLSEVETVRLKNLDFLSGNSCTLKTSIVATALFLVSVSEETIDGFDGA
ncbi:hypothetical protein Tco_1338532 [Tanacetum coccineum]